MKIGMMVHDLSSDILNFIKAIGVNHICGLDYTDFSYDKQGYWDADLLQAARKHIEAHGIKLDMFALPLPQVSVDRADLPNIMLSTVDRDEEIQRVSNCIRAAGQAGIPALKCNLTITGGLRTELAVGRGRAVHSAFNIERLDVPTTIAGPVTSEQVWERISYFVDRVIPVAEDVGVRLACHPHDPAVPQGIGLDDRVLGTIDGLKEYCALSLSPYHGLNFCQGCIEETGASKEESLDAIYYFGREKRLFIVHFRTIRGGFLNFREAFIDEGDMDLLAAMNAYQDVGYEHMIVPDHYPRILGDSRWGHQSRAYAVGYIRALLSAL